jgi:branched-chain amino acid transport system ATP-binding protein
LSGGQQQMLTLARALATSPDVLLADELSLGLAPLLVQRLLGAVREAAARGVGVLLVEQHARQALGVADRVYVLQRGRVALEGPAHEILDRLDEVEHAYLEGPVLEGATKE